VGKACSVAADCPAGTFCVDGVCCDSTCSGTCLACTGLLFREYRRRRIRLGRYFALFDLFVGSMVFVCLVDNLGYLWVGIEATALADAVERSDDAARDLPRAERLGRLLDEQAQRSRIDQDALADEDYVEDTLWIERVEPRALWFEGDIGPVPVSAAAAKLAKPGWSMYVVLGRQGGKWHVLEVGNVYP